MNKQKMLVFECIECKTQVLIGIRTDGFRCYKCGSPIVPIRDATEQDVKTIKRVSSADMKVKYVMDKREETIIKLRAIVDDLEKGYNGHDNLIGFEVLVGTTYAQSITLNNINKELSMYADIVTNRNDK